MHGARSGWFCRAKIPKLESFDHDGDCAIESQVPRSSSSRHGRDRMFLGNLKIGARLGLAFAAILVMLLGIIALGVSRLESQDRLLSDFASVDVPGVATSLKWANSVLETARHIDGGKIREQ